MVEPSETELEVLKLFWREGVMSGREVQDALPSELRWAPSTTRTVLERMRAKGLLDRRSVHGVAVYAPAQEKVTVIGGALRRILRRVLEIDACLPVAAFSSSRLLGEEDLAALEKILNAEPTEERP